MASKRPLASSNISRTTISFLLSLYPHTVKEYYRTKLTAKSPSKVGTQSTSKRPTAKGKSEETIEKEVETFLKLDKLRYETIPAALKNRAGTVPTPDKNDDAKGKEDAKRPSKKAKLSKDDGDSPPSSPFLEKDDIVNLMDWKLKHGSHRPALMGMIRSNSDSLVRSTTRTAFSQLQTTLSSTGNDAFPGVPLETLTGPLRGVGPATASLFLSIVPCQSSSNDTINMNTNAAPFFSDELFNWLCLDKYAHDFPNSSSGGPRAQGKSPASTEAKIKYNTKEYRALWEAVKEIRERVNQIPGQKALVGNGSGTGEGESRNFSVLDIEKVAFVIGHIDVSGYEKEMKEANMVEDLHDGKADDVGAVSVAAFTDVKGMNAGKGKRKRGSRV